jgi:Carboxypeptidase regulatory-like domain
MVRRRLDELAPPSQLKRSMLLCPMNRRHAIVIAFLVLLYAGATETSAGQRPVPREFSYPEASQSVEIEVGAGTLSGIVADPNGGPLTNVLVERVGASWANRVSAVLTDSRGRFRFSRQPNGDYYLKITKPNFSTLKVKVNLRKGSKSKLRLRLPLGI